MNSINQNYYNNYDLSHKQIGFKSETAQEVQPVQVPDLYYIPEYKDKPKNFKEKVKQWDVMGLVYQWLAHPLLMIGACAGLSIGIDAFDRSCNKEYSKSIVGKAAKFGDKIEKSKLIQSNPVQKVLGGIKEGWGRIKKTAMKNDIISAMVKTPSRPENSMPKDELKHSNFRVVSQFKELARDIGLTDADAEIKKSWNPLNGTSGGKKKILSWKDWDLTNDEIKYLKDSFGEKDLSKVSKEVLGDRIKLKRAGLAESEISEILAKADSSKLVREKLLEKGGRDAAWMEKVLKDETGACADEVRDFCKKLEGQRINKSWCKIPVLSKLFSNVRGTNSVANRLSSMSDGAKTSTGRFMSKLLQKFHRGITFGGGKFMVLLFVGPMMVEALLNTKKADKKEKVGTLVSGMIEPATWVFTFPLILRFMHSYGGIQYAGMSPEKVAEYRNEIEKFNKRVDDKEFKDFKSYNTAKKELKTKLKSLRHVENQGVFTSIMRKISHITKCDLEKINSYKNGNAIGNIIRKIPNTLKNITFGYVGRFGLFMMAFMPFLDKVIKKGLNTVFGKSYDQYKEEEFVDNKKRQEEFSVNDMRTRLEEAQRRKLQAQAMTTDPKLNNAVQNQKQSDFKPVADAKETEQEKEPETLKTENKIVNNNTTEENKPIQQKETQEEGVKEASVLPAATAAALNKNNSVKPNNSTKSPFAPDKTLEQTPVINPKRDNYTYIPSQDSVFKNPKLNQTEKYIPSQTAAKFTKTFDNSKVEKVLRHASKAEQKAINVLGGNFENP